MIYEQDICRWINHCR